MPRKHKKTRGGSGIVDSLGQTFSNLGSSISRGVKDAWGKLSNSTQNTSSYQPPIQNNSYQSSQPPPYQPTTNFGGTKTKQRYSHRRYKHKRGGSYRDNMSLTNLASHAAPFSGNTAQPHNWVGGKTKRRRKSAKHTKRRRH
jgi:hypothetical protein